MLATVMLDYPKKTYQDGLNVCASFHTSQRSLYMRWLPSFRVPSWSMTMCELRGWLMIEYVLSWYVRIAPERPIRPQAIPKRVAQANSWHLVCWSLHTRRIGPHIWNWEWSAKKAACSKEGLIYVETVPEYTRVWLALKMGFCLKLEDHYQDTRRSNPAFDSPGKETEKHSYFQGW